MALALSLIGCTSADTTATKGQLIECQVATDGTASDCQPVDQPSNSPGTCVDVDDDGDGDSHDAEAEDDDDDDANVTGETDDDDDGVPDGEDDDDDNDRDRRRPRLRRGVGW